MTDSNELSLLSIRDNQLTWDVDQKKAIIDNLGLTHATDADMAVFFHMCRRTQLDPFRRQIYMISRLTWNPETRTKEPKQTFQTGIDGYRVIAERSAAKQGVKLKKARFEYWDHDGTKSDVWFKDEPPAMIRATVQLGSEEPAIWDARFSEYVPMIEETEWQEVNGKNKRVGTGKMVRQGMWAQRPTAQLEKCAEAGALRRCCPEDLSNLYVDAEMTRMGNADDQPPITRIVDDGRPTKDGRDWLDEIATARDHEGWDEAAVLRKIWKDAAAAGELSPEIRVAINSRGAELTAQTAEAETPPEPPAESEGDSGDSGDSSDSSDSAPSVTGDCRGCGATDVETVDDLCETCQADLAFQGGAE